MKARVKTEHDNSNGNGPRAAIDALCTIVETALSYRAESKPSLTTVAKLANRGSGLLKLSDVDVKISVENAATVALAKKLNLVA